MDTCPSCGKDVDSLNDYTGWCDSCTPPEYLNKCPRCKERSDRRGFCRKCRDALWLEANADVIDRYIAQGFKLNAIRAMLDDFKLSCRACGGPMKKASNGQAFFCTANEDCRKAQRRFRNLIYKRKLTREEALNKILSERANAN